MVVYGRMPRNTIDLINQAVKEEAVDDFVKRMQQIHGIVKNNIVEENANYKLAVDKSRKERVFNVGDLVMIHLRKGYFLAGTYSKLHK